MRAAFDLVANPQLIQPDYGFYGIFLGAGVFLAILTLIAVRLDWKLRSSLRVFTPFWIVLVGILTFMHARDVFRVQEMVRQGDFSTVEGCLGSFRPGSPSGTRTTAGQERWSVAGHEFAYGQGQPDPYYQTVQAKGGMVRPDSYVRVSFVPSPSSGENKIVRLEALSAGCPAAADKSQ